MKTLSNDRLVNLSRQFPEWRPWLTVIEEVLRETINSKWEAFVPESVELQHSQVPLLAGAQLILETTVVIDWLERLMQTAHRSGAPKMSPFNFSKRRLTHIAVNLFRAALCQDDKELGAIAADLGVEAEAHQALALLAPVPFLQACHRRWEPAISASWRHGYCPVCGAWSTVAEVRGIERSRYLRCGRCGSGWQAQYLSCPYCAMTDHKELVSLVPEKSAANAVIDACKRCLGYVKTFTRLQGSPPDEVMIDDLASVEFDIAALRQGYRRPEGTGYPLHVTVGSKRTLKQTIFSWGR